MTSYKVPALYDCCYGSRVALGIFYAHDMFKSAGVSMILQAGSMLGSVMKKKVATNDYDSDAYFLQPELPAVLKVQVTVIEADGFKATDCHNHRHTYNKYDLVTDDVWFSQLPGGRKFWHIHNVTIGGPNADGKYKASSPSEEISVLDTPCGAFYGLLGDSTKHWAEMGTDYMTLIQKGERMFSGATYWRHAQGLQRGVPKDWIYPIRPCEIQGEEVGCVNNAWAMTRALYGNETGCCCCWYPFANEKWFEMQGPAAPRSLSMIEAAKRQNKTFLSPASWNQEVESGNLNMSDVTDWYGAPAPFDDWGSNTCADCDCISYIPEGSDSGVLPVITTSKFLPFDANNPTVNSLNQCCRCTTMKHMGSSTRVNFRTFHSKDVSIAWSSVG